ncbi:MAG: histidine phosphatase family protein [Rhodospirillales bacterium]
MSEGQLLLLRHAKSSWRDPSLADHDRPLNRRGRRAAVRMGEYLQEEGLLPDLVLCSTATRTRATWELASRSLLGGAPAHLLDRRLYHASPNDLLRVIADTAANARRLLVIGHNPGLEQLALRLAGPTSDPACVADLQQKYPTAALALFSCAASTWAELSEETCRLVRFVVPAKLSPAPA